MSEFASLIELAFAAPPLVPIVWRRDISTMLRGHEPMIARSIGETRDAESRAVGNRGDELSPDDRRWRHVNACGAEIAVARFLNLYPHAFLGIAFANRCGDVGAVQVRNTQTGCLYLYREGNSLGYRPSRPGDTYVLTVGTLPRYCIAGWLVAGDGMRDEYWRTDLRCPCWAIPRERLRPFAIIDGKVTL